MNDPELSADLAALERRMAERPRIEPSPEFGSRVLSASSAVLARRRASARWRAWASVAAALLLGINLSMSMAANTDWHLLPRGEPGRTAEVSRLRELAPELPEAELRRQALLARAGADLPPTVNLMPTWERFHTTKEPDRWDER
jgi:hypothetical protein